MANNLFKLIKNKARLPFDKEDPLDVHALIRCSTEEARSYLPFKLAEKLNVLPLAVIDLHTRKLLTAAAPNTSVELQKSLAFSCGIDVKLISLGEKILRKAIFLAYNGSDYALSENIEKLGSISVEQPKQTPQSGISSISCEVNDFLKALLTYAIVKKASDIHFLPYRDGLFIKLRVDGELRTHDSPICNLDVYKRVVSRLKTLSNLDITMSDTAHDGSLVYELDESSISIRISIMPTIHGEKVVLRLHGIRDLLKLESLGLDIKTLDFIEQSSSKMKGLILCTGSTGSGKSTTLYAILEKISHFNKSIITVEDPVEIKLPFASQTSINTKKGFSYAETLRAALRQDPDCIMIGELRDSLSSKIAFEAALTGHLVITSMHAGSVMEALRRLFEMGIDNLTVSQTCSLIINQRLEPRLCGSCKVFDLEASRVSNEKVYKAVGCRACDYSGFINRIIACESLQPDEKVRECLLSSKSLSNLSNKFTFSNYQSMQDSLNLLLRRGEINLDSIKV